ncbi:NF-kappa-B essential modulator-like isoform X1 [Sinocyclocheilus anshuiensis]|uniref:NF-kappa-B essential modulator-like isoform X1 n=1 Tax=Sinocyclocheilus anshuiensis TaxID=1608454 RepID=UPI0007B94FF8|nr:PREDICTED: NF-kappa-B essential modulator-like isoform X1 [Sinocyclocheilus anshuiensis]
MVQPQLSGGCTLQWELTGEETVGAEGQGSLMANSQGSMRVPPELAGNEVVNRLIADNHQLREALKRSNDALKERCEEMEGWQRRSREERDFLSCRFREARALVQRLAQENQSLLGQLNHCISQTGSPRVGISKETGNQSQDQELKCTNVLMDSPEVLNEAVLTDRSEGDAYRHTMPQSLPAEGSNEFLKLLKSHKEKLEEGMRVLRRRNEELEKEKAEYEKERENLHTTVEQLRSKLTQNVGVTEESVQQTCALTVPAESSHLAKLTEQLQATQGRYRELQEKLDCLQKNSVQRDRTEALLKQKEKDFIQLTKDSEALRAQVTSLLGELNERQNWLEKSEAERQILEDKLCKKTERLQILERDMEQQKKQHSVTVDNLLLQTQNLETALKNERLVIVEERRKLAQLQHAYTCLFQDYDKKLKSEKQANQRSGEADTLANRLAEAEKALALKQDLIDKLKEETEQLRATLETIPVLNAQAEIYKMDFLAEREAREKLNQKKEELQEGLSKALVEIDRLKQEGTSRARIEEMQQRHLEDYRPRPHPPPPAAPFAGAAMFNPAQPPSARRRDDDQDELPDYRCPKCMYKAPDMDTLQIHVMDCIQ